MRITAEALLPAGAVMTPAEIVRLESYISEQMSTRIAAFMRDEQRRLEHEMLYGTSASAPSPDLLYPPVRASR